ncbi:hypothetical protein ACFLYO_00240 [Chloroflexota bacterium]
MTKYLTPARIFSLQRVTALALVVFFTLHMMLMHYPPLHIDFDVIAERLQHPFWKAVDILFLLAVLIHALLGVYMVLTDWQRIARYKNALLAIALVLFVLGMFYGTMTVLQFNPA